MVGSARHSSDDGGDSRWSAGPAFCPDASEKFLDRLRRQYAATENLENIVVTFGDRPSVEVVSDIVVVSLGRLDRCIGGAVLWARPKVDGVGAVLCLGLTSDVVRAGAGAVVECICWRTMCGTLDYLPPEMV
ncbi:hypothetical protein CASFOL_016114 [Castilleja foliolosa]|uniref:Uncharacterized protein n=1 Tax=Castilleja foliolosa TaxID=1961234 RepID=A0ABD3DHP3_9LAMI